MLAVNFCLDNEKDFDKQVRNGKTYKQLCLYVLLIYMLIYATLRIVENLSSYDIVKCTQLNKVT